MADDVNIREGKTLDFASFTYLFGLVEQFHRERLPSRFREPPEDFPENFLKETLADNNAKLFVAESRGNVVGYLFPLIKEMASHPSMKPGKFISVEELAVAPEMRRRKIGRQLMARAEEFARKRGFHEIELNIWKVNGAAEAFYKELGYQTTRTYLSKRLTE